jgi:long-chain acyl-CoA synthetase
MEHAWDRRLGMWWIADDHPRQLAVASDPDGVAPLTFGELAGKAHQLVHALRGAGLRAGDIVAYAFPNCVDHVVWQLAAQESGLWIIALNPALVREEVATILDHSGASLLALHAELSEPLGPVADSAPSMIRVSVHGPIPGFTPIEALLDGMPTTPPPDRTLGGPIRYSSGTTGAPKAIVRPLPQGADPSVSADEQKVFGRAFRFEPLEGVHLVSAGMHHGGCQSFLFGALHVGQALAITGRFDAEAALATIDRHGVTTAYMVPTQFVRLVRLPDDVKQRYDVSSLRSVVHAAAPCPVEVKQEMMRWWGPVIWETYGGMEGAATIAKPHRWIEKPGTVGRAIRGMTIQILDDDGNELPAGEIGDIYLRPQAPTFEYKDDAELMAEVSRGDAFTLGDIGYLDEDGYLFIRDRAKDMIISGGVNIFPAEIEGALSAHPAVGDVAVIGVPDPEWGESVKAVVELVDGAGASEALAAELIAFCRDRLGRHKIPRSVDFRTDLPRTDGGKLMKRQLRDVYWGPSGRSV